MHQAAIRILTTALQAKFHHVTRAQENVTHAEAQASHRAAGEYTEKRLKMARELLEREQRTLAELEGSIRTLKAAEPVHAVHASYGPGQKVAIMGGPHKSDHGTIETIGDDGVLEVRLVAGSVVPVKPSSVRATN
ncbi:hypothetical protein SEA_WHEELBITE_54 [Arthrobacter phage Wheelbite]|uniref:KOW domain-containing protein n=1 Tax=Arthrobacter phage Wheelbite TaxID=2015873 RepID=A0A222ZIB9_9CAUD|nr:hypothetical protein KMD23_gp54 [Arthrobacter phage Wheelbite]ASR84145.1 hypothetical protein SEA_WHEELBITE_54 [Arthrobacter phage Wheelbite]